MIIETSSNQHFRVVDMGGVWLGYEVKRKGGKWVPAKAHPRPITIPKAATRIVEE